MSPPDLLLLVILDALRTPGVKPGSQAWGACMMPLHYVRCWCHREVTTQRQPSIFRMHIVQWLRSGAPCGRNGFDSCARGSATAVRHGWRRLWSLDRSECCAESTEAWTLLASLHTLRTPGVEPGSQAWGACMMPLHYVRCWSQSEVITIARPLFWSACIAQRHHARPPMP